jgi:hypothetical protein
MQFGTGTHDNGTNSDLRENRIRGIAAEEMLTVFQKLFTNMMTVEFTSAVPEKVLDTLVLEKIALSDIVRKSDLCYQLKIHRKNYNYLSALLNRRGEHLKIIQFSYL